MRAASSFVRIVGAASMFAFLACGGSTTSDLLGATPGDDGGAATGATGTTGASGSAGTTATTTTTTGGSGGAGGQSGTGGTGFDPGGIGTIIGGVDAGAFDAGVAVGAPISPEVVDGCNALCAKEATANCANQGTTASCVVGCRLLLNNPKCAARTSALFKCEATSDVACDAQGKATLTGCAAEQVGAASCFLDNAVDPTLNGPCTTYCANVASAMCPNDDAGCPSSCPILGNLIPACNPLWKDYVACASTAKMACGNDGKAGAPACGLQGARFFLCLEGGVLNTGDAGM
jgi:hypothetical protein